MSSRPLIRPYPSILNGNMAGSLTSDVTIIDNLSKFSYSYSWAGTSPVGSISVQVSNDFTQNAAGVVQNAGTWNSITFNLAGAPVSSAPVSGNTGTGFIDVESLSGYAVRTVYTRVSGTGTLQAILVAKVA